MLARVGLEMACDAMVRQAVKLAGRALARASELRTRLDAGVRSMVSMFCYGGLRKIRNGDGGFNWEPPARVQGVARVVGVR